MVGGRVPPSHCGNSSVESRECRRRRLPRMVIGLRGLERCDLPRLGLNGHEFGNLEKVHLLVSVWSELLRFGTPTSPSLGSGTGCRATSTSIESISWSSNCCCCSSSSCCARSSRPSSSPESSSASSNCRELCIVSLEA